ncbi:hypothetical protein INR49_012853 [Caranx melampygus]|nr:hypothetical protein INR49_012853 [Caranx melampygus]
MRSSNSAQNQGSQEESGESNPRDPHHTEEERRSPLALPLAIRPEADGNTQTAGTRGAKRLRGRRVREGERPVESKRESNCCHRLGVVFATGIETDKYRNKGPRQRFREEKEDK